MSYYLFMNNAVVGPMDVEQLMCYGVNRETSVSTDGHDWKPLYMYPELMQRLSMAQSGNQQSSSDSQRILCGVLALLVGYLGIHYFIMGKTTAGILTILLSLVTCGVWGLVMFIQGILILTMNDADFERKFVNSTSTFPVF